MTWEVSGGMYATNLSKSKAVEVNLILPARLHPRGSRENMKRFFLHVARHPADSDGRPTAGAQVLVRVSMIP